MSAYSEEFSDRLNSVLEEIFDQSVPFYQTDNEDHCKNCDFKMLCNR
ncbi:MAG: PD-(D/E)XK nuclease family protein [Bacteroidaceae bacterium]|nr:PD-(D/E)XK nuclease family protein [Bacteroidaceae bacterium]